MGMFSEKALRIVLISITILLAANAQATVTTVVDFEEFGDAVVGPVSGITSKGYDLDWIGGGNYALDTIGIWPDNGTTLFFCPTCAPSEGFALSNAAGNPFSLLSFESSFSFGTAGTLTVTGLRNDSSTVNLFIDDLTDEMKTINLDGNWNNLVSVTFEGINTSGEVFNAIGFDNITVSAIPVPAAVWLLGSGLISLAALRRRKH